MKRIIVLALMFVLLICSKGYSAQVTASWNPNSESHLLGYKIHYGNSSGAYTTTIDVENVTSYVVLNLVEGTTYYFALTAYGIGDVESIYSDEVSYEVPYSPLAPPSNLRLSGINTFTWDGIGNEFTVYRNSSTYKTVYDNTVAISGRHKQLYYFEVESVYGRSERIRIKFYGWKGREV